MRRTRGRSLYFLVPTLLLAFCLAACGGGGGTSTLGVGAGGGGDTNIYTYSLDPTGGMIASGNLKIYVPTNTLFDGTTITISNVNTPTFGSINDTPISKTFQVHTPIEFYAINNEYISIVLPFDYQKANLALLNESNTIVNVNFPDGSTFPVFGNLADNNISIVMAGFPNLPITFTVVQKTGDTSFNDNPINSFNNKSRSLYSIGQMSWDNYQWDVSIDLERINIFRNYHLNNNSTEAELIDDGDIFLIDMARMLGYASVYDLKINEVVNNARIISEYAGNTLQLQEPSYKRIIISDKYTKYGGATVPNPWTKYFAGIYISPSEFDDNIYGDDIKGGFRSTLAHEIFHKIFYRYEITDQYTQAVNESSAALFGSTLGKGEVSMMKLHSPYPMNISLFKNFNGYNLHLNYHYQGFLYYLGKKYLGNNIMYLKPFAEEYKNEWRSVWTLGSTFPGWWDIEKAIIKGAYASLDKTINDINYTTDLRTSFWDFVKNYGFEHNIESDPYNQRPDIFFCKEDAFLSGFNQDPIQYNSISSKTFIIPIGKMSANYLKFVPGAGVDTLNIGIRFQGNDIRENIRLKIYWVKSGIASNTIYMQEEINGSNLSDLEYLERNVSGHGSQFDSIYILAANLDYENDVQIEIKYSTGTAGTLVVSPLGGLDSLGVQGGPFSPSSIGYTLSNPGGAAIIWTASNTQSWVTLSSAGGALAAGASATVFVSVNPDGNNLTAGNYSDTVTFTNTTNGIGNATRTVSLNVNSAEAPTITTSTLPNGAVGTSYSQQFYATGGTLPYAWSVPTGSLPGGLTVSSSGVLSGIPTTANVYNFVVRVTGNDGVFSDKAFSLTVSGSSPTVLSWTKFYGGADFDDAHSVQQTSDGGYIVAGWTSSFGTTGQAYLLKTDSLGNKVWERTFGLAWGPAESVRQTSDGGYILAGANSPWGGNIYLIKTDESGYEMWRKSYPALEGNSVQQTSDGGYIIAGKDTYFGNGDVLLIRTNPSGEPIWTKYFGRPNGVETAKSVQQTVDGGFIAAGYTSSFSADSSADVYLVKVNASGELVWEKNIGGQFGQGGNSVRQTTDGGYIIAGFGSTALYSVDYVYVVKTNPFGEVIWSRTIGTADSSQNAQSVDQTTDGDYIVAGLKTGAGMTDVYLIKLDASGNDVWSRTFGGPYTDEGYSVQQTTDGGYIIAGRGTPVPLVTGYPDAYLIKTDPDGNVNP